MEDGGRRSKDDTDRALASQPTRRKRPDDVPRLGDSQRAAAGAAVLLLLLLYRVLPTSVVDDAVAYDCCQALTSLDKCV